MGDLWPGVVAHITKQLRDGPWMPTLGTEWKDHLSYPQKCRLTPEPAGQDPTTVNGVPELVGLPWLRPEPLRGAGS
ncbi:hypothetical protein GCM10010442_57230 [Kitasatospora kifunensis]